MKPNKPYVDISSFFDDVFEAAKDFGEKFKDFGPNFADRKTAEGTDNAGPGDCGCGSAKGGAWFEAHAEDNADYYPNFSYPPMNIYLTPARDIVFEFALAGFDEKNINLTFQGDYMVFSARIDAEEPVEGQRYIKRRLKMKDIDKQKYYVPADKFDQAKVKAVFKNGILRVVIPPKEQTDDNEGIKIEIVREGE
jgi:HSP20 family molecular chaperone IbpA